MEEYNKNSAEMKTRIAQLQSEKETLSLQYSTLTDVNSKVKFVVYSPLEP